MAEIFEISDLEALSPLFSNVTKHRHFLASSSAPPESDSSNHLLRKTTTSLKSCSSDKPRSLQR
jgi:hypothetical protein